MWDDAMALGNTAVVHTWGRNLIFHPHLHCIVTGGAARLGRLGRKVSLARRSAPPTVSRKIPRRSCQTFRPRRARHYISYSSTGRQPARAWRLRSTEERTLREGLGRLHQGALPKARRTLSLPRPLHSPGCHLQPSHSPRRRRQSRLPNPRQKGLSAGATGIHATLSATRLATRLRENQTLRSLRRRKCQFKARFRSR